MTTTELALLFIKQMREYDENMSFEPDEPQAVYVWEDWISNDPERAWPVFEEILTRTSDDELLEQVWYRLRLLLYGNYDSFRDRAAELFERFERFAYVAGANALDAKRYREKPLDREALIEAYRAVLRTCEASPTIGRLAETEPDRALAIAVEIIHRGMAKGWGSLDLMLPLQEVVAKSGHRVVDELEEIARASVAVRRVLWRLQRQLASWHLAGNEHEMGSVDLKTRLERVVGTTTDYTERDVPLPRPTPQLDTDEELIADWFVHQRNLWAFSTLNELCDDEPSLAWSITLDLINRADDESELGTIAAGPLEDLVRKHSDEIWTDVVERAHTDERFLRALHGVWVFESDGDVFHRLRDLLETADANPN